MYNISGKFMDVKWANISDSSIEITSEIEGTAELVIILCGFMVVCDPSYNAYRTTIYTNMEVQIRLQITDYSDLAKSRHNSDVILMFIFVEM